MQLIDWCNRAPPRVLRTASTVRQTVKLKCFLLTFLFKLLFLFVCFALYCSSWQLLLRARGSSELQKVRLKPCCAEQRPLSVGIKWPLAKSRMCCVFCFVFFFLLHNPERRFTRQRSALLKRMHAGMCLMIHRPAPLWNPKWILWICLAL